MIIPDAAPKISNDKKSLNSRHILPLSFLSRKKRKQKKVDFRRVFFAAPAVFTNLQHKTDGSHTNRLLFFLEEKKQKKIICGAVILCAPAAFANLQHKTDGSHTNRLLFFLEEKKQKKINGGRAASLRSSRFRQPVTQNGRFTYEPSSFLFRRKEAKENQRRESGFSALQPLSPTCNTKRTVHIRTVRFFVPSRTCGKTSFLRKTSSPAVSFVSFLQEKKTYPFRRKEIVPL